MKKIGLWITLLLAASLLCGCGAAQPADGFSPAIQQDITINFLIPWDEPEPMELCYNPAGIVYARFNGVDDVSPEDAVVTVIRAEGSSAELQMVWNWGDVHTILVEDNQVKTVTASGSWEDWYNENWESIEQRSDAPFAATGTWEDVYSADAVQIMSRSTADFSEYASELTWSNVTTSYYDKDELVKKVSREMYSDGSDFTESLFYQGELVTERQRQQIYKEDTEWCVRHIIDRSQPMADDLCYGDEVVRTGLVENFAVWYPVSEPQYTAEQLLAADLPITRGNLLIEEYTYDEQTGTWYDLRHRFYEAETEGLQEHFSSLESAKEAFRGCEDSDINMYRYGQNTGEGWEWFSDYYNCQPVIDLMIKDGNAGMLTKYGLDMAAVQYKPEEAIEYLIRLYEAGVTSAAPVLGEVVEVVFDLYNLHIITPDNASTCLKTAYDELGDKVSSYFLGIIYANDLNDLSQSVQWFEKSYEGGEIAAAFKLGQVYQAMHEQEMARQWFQTAYDAGFEDAAQYLN